MPTPPRPRGRLARLFFSQLGMLFSIIVYFTLFERGGRTIAALTPAVWVALSLHTTYLLFARWHGELKQFDIGFWLLLAIGLVSAILGIEPVLWLYQHYSAALLFTTFGLVAVIPLLLGREPFTVWFAVRQTPRWQHRTPAFATISRVLAAFWALIFFTAARVVALRPAVPMFTALFPTLLIVLVGLPPNPWLPPLWFKLFPPPAPDAAEPLIMGMPFVFDRAAAADARAVFQFRVTGQEPGDYWVRVAGGRCERFEGGGPRAGLTVRTPARVWGGIVRGEVDGGQALMERQYSVEGDPALLVKLRDWFPGGRG